MKRIIVLLLMALCAGPVWGQKKFKDITPAPSLNSGTWFVGTQNNAGIWTDYLFSAAQVATYVGAPSLQQVLGNGNTTSGIPILVKVPGTLNKTTILITSTLIKIQDTLGVNYISMQQPFGSGASSLASLTFGYMGYQSRIQSIPTVNRADTIPDDDGTFALTKQLRAQIVQVGDSACTVPDRSYQGLVLMLSAVTADRNLALPQANKCPGCHIEVHNANASGFDRTFITNIPKDAAGANITAMTDETWYVLVSDGTSWWRTN